MKLDKKILTRILMAVILLTVMLALTGCEGVPMLSLEFPIDTGNVSVDNVLDIVWTVLVIVVVVVILVVVIVWVVIHAAIAGLAALIIWLVKLIVEFVMGLI